METKNQKILMVDDSAFMRTVLKNILENVGYVNFVEVGNGNEALEKIKTEHPDLILLDIIMPDKGGIEVLKEVGTTNNVIMITAVGQEKIIEEAKNLGAKGYLIKPFDNRQVEAEVKKILG
jgi:two-component system chemotaxis response regulator CheY